MTLLFGRGFAIACVVLATVVVGACGSSPSSPSPAGGASDGTGPGLVVAPTSIHRTAEYNTYHPSFSLSVPQTGTEITVRRVDFTVLGPDGSVYGVVTDGAPIPNRVGPGSAIGGAAWPYVDRAVNRPLATRYRLRFSYTRADGTTADIEATSTFTTS